MESGKGNDLKRELSCGPLGRQQRVIDASHWFGESPEVLLVYGEEVYRLRLTRSGKLLLTK